MAQRLNLSTFCSQEVQAEVFKSWETIETDTLKELSDYAGYQQEFLRLFGFGIDGVDYDASPEIDVPLPISQA